MKATLAGLCLVLGTLVHQVLTSITPRSQNTVNVTLGPHDTMSIFMPELFNLRNAQSPYFTVDNGAKIYNFTVPFKDASLEQFDINVIHQIIDLGNGVIGLLYNNKSFMFLPISKDGKHFGTPRVYSDNNLGTSTVCDDMILNTVAARVYVSCHNDDATAQEPGKSYIYELDYQTATLIQKITIDQSVDGFFVEVASKMRIIELVQGSTKARVLIFYSQALSGTPGLNSNKYFRFLTGVDTGNLAYNPKNLIDFSDTNLNFRAFYDIFQHRNYLVMSGIPSTNYTNIALKACYLDIQAVEFMCRPEIQNTSISIGWAGIVNDNRYVEVDLVTGNHSVICNIGNDFASPNWLTDCFYNDSIATFSESYIRDVELDNSALLIEYVYPDATYRGYAVHVLHTGLNSLHTDLVGTLAEDKLVYIDPKDYGVHMVWLVPDFVFINATATGQSTTFKITAYDNQTTGGVSTSVFVKVQSTYIGDTAMSSSYQWPELDIMQGSYFYWPMNTFDVSGNALSYNLSFTPDMEGLFETHIYHMNQADIAFITDDPNNLDMSRVVVGDGFAIALDKNNVLSFYSCDYPGINSFVCRSRAYFPLKSGAKLYHRTASFGVMMGFCYTTDNQGTTFYLFDGLRAAAYPLNGIFPSDVDVFTAQNEDKRTIGILSYGRNDQKMQGVGIMTFELGDIHSLKPSSFLTKDNTQDGYLCPSRIQGNNDGFLAVTSVCHGEIFSDSRVIVYSWPGPRPLLETPLHNWNGTFVNPMACYFGHSLLVSGFDTTQNKTRLYLTEGAIEDPSEEYFGLDEYGLTNIASINCAEENELFSVVSNNPDGTKNIGTFHAQSRGRADRRAHSLVSNLNIVDATAFGMRHGLIHVTYDKSGYPFFWISYMNGPFIYTDVSTSQEYKKENYRLFKGTGLKSDSVTSSSVTFSITNPAGKTAQSTSNYTLRNPDTTIRLENTQNKPALQSGLILLENYVNISGPIFSAQVSDMNTSRPSNAVHLQQRIELLNVFRREGRLVYDIIRSVGPRTYAVAVDKDISLVDYFHDGQHVKTLSGLGAGEFKAFTVVNIDPNQGIDLLFYSLEEGGYPQIFVQIYQNGVRKYSKASSGRGEAIDLQGVMASNNQVYLFAQTMMDIEFYVVDFSDMSNLNIQQVNALYGFRDMSVVLGVDHVYVMGFGFEDNNISGYSVSLDSSHSISGPVALHPEHQYRLFKIACRHFNSSHMVCVANTESTFLVESYIDYSLSTITSHFHEKYGYYEGFEVDVAGNYIYMFGRTSKPGVLSMAILSWRTRVSGGTGKLWYGLQLPLPTDHVLDIHYQAPFTAHHDPESNDGDAYLVAGTLYSDYPIGFFRTSTFKLNVSDANVDLSTINFSFQGLSTTQVTLKELFAIPYSGSANWWPFVLMIGILVACAIAFFVYARIKAEGVKSGSEIGGASSGHYATITTKEPLKEQL